MLDAIAKRYGVLPSRLLAEGDTLDLTVMDVAVSYERHLHNKKTGNATEDYDEQSLINAMDRVKSRNK